MLRPLKVIVIEKSASDMELILQALERDGRPITSERVETADDLRAVLAGGPWDIVLADFTAPDLSVSVALNIIHSADPDLPFVVVSDSISEEVASELLQVGVNDWVLKRSLARLVSVVNRELRATKNRRDQRVAEVAARQLAAIVESSEDAIIGEDLEGTITSWNPAAERLYGWTRKEAVGLKASNVVPSTQWVELDLIRERLRLGEHIPTYETERVRKDGTVFPVSITISPVYGLGGELIGISKVVRDITESKQSEQALRQSEAEYRALADNIPQLVWLADAEGAVQYCNQRWLEYTGLTLEQVLGWGWAQALFPADLNMIRERWQVSESTGRTYEAEYRLLGKDGNYRWFLDRGMAVKDEAGNIIRWVGTCTDIEAQKQERLAQSQLAAIVAASEDAIISINRDGVIETWNPGAERLFGYSTSEVVGVPLIHLLPPGLASTQLTLAERVHSGEPIRGVNSTFIKKDGQTIELSQTLSPIRDAEDQIIGISIISRDLTEQQRLHAEHAALLDRLRLYLARSPIGCIVTGPDRRIREWNPAAERIFGYPYAEAVGKTIDELGLVPESAREHVESIRARLLAGDMSAHCADKNRTRDGRIIDCEWYNTPLLEPDGSYSGSMAMCLDTTEKRQLEAQFRHSQKMVGIGQLAGGIAHDFNNMLAVICGYTEMVLALLGTGHQARAHLIEVQKAADRAAALTRQLLAFSRRQLLAPKVLDLNQLVLDLDAMLRRLIGEDIEFITLTHPEPVWVKADPGQLEQVLVNLVVNARDAMPGGGSLTLRTEQVHLDSGFVAQHATVEPGAYAMLSVQDTGSGMDGNTLASIFEPFFTTKDVGKGTGLGLSTVYGIVTQSDGCVDVESKVGQGSTFWVYLPRVSPPAEMDARLVVPTLPTGTETILVVEDEPMVRALVVEVLRSTGYTVLQAMQADEALLLVDQHPEPIHLLLTDVVMPRMSGPALAEAFLARRPGTPVLFMSGYMENTVVLPGMTSGELELLEKPFGPRLLAERVRRVLDTHRSQEASGVILVVDDSPNDRELLAEILRKGGYVVVTAADGTAAMKLLKETIRPELIIFDLVMPGMNGWVFRKELMNDLELRDIPTIAISGRADPGATEFLTVTASLLKPCRAPELLELVSRCLSPAVT